MAAKYKLFSEVLQRNLSPCQVTMFTPMVVYSLPAGNLHCSLLPKRLAAAHHLPFLNALGVV